MIEKLTKEQEAKIPEYVEWGKRVGLNTDRISEERAVAYTTKINTFMKRPVGKTLLASGPRDAWRLVQEVTGTQENFVWPMLDGQYMSYWVAWANYIRDVLNLKLIDYSIIADQVDFGMVFPLEDGTVVYSDRPTEIHLNSSGLHKDFGPAVKYLDGTMVWMLNGVKCPEDLVMTKPEKLDCKKWIQHDNAEVRREFVRKIGVERLLVKLGGTKLDTAGDYELHEIDLGGSIGKWPALKMLNPSIGVWHVEWVDKACKTVDAALAWRNHGEAHPAQLT